MVLFAFSCFLFSTISQLIGKQIITVSQLTGVLRYNHLTTISQLIGKQLIAVSQLTCALRHNHSHHSHSPPFTRTSTYHNDPARDDI